MTQYPKAVSNNRFISTSNYQTWCLKVYFKDKAWIITRLLIELEARNDQWSDSRGEYLPRRSLSQLPFVPIYSDFKACISATYLLPARKRTLHGAPREFLGKGMKRKNHQKKEGSFGMLYPCFFAQAIVLPHLFRWRISTSHQMP